MHLYGKKAIFMALQDTEFPHHNQKLLWVLAIVTHSVYAQQGEKIELTTMGGSHRRLGKLVLSLL